MPRVTGGGAKCVEHLTDTVIHSCVSFVHLDHCGTFLALSRLLSLVSLYIVIDIRSSGFRFSDHASLHGCSCCLLVLVPSLVLLAFYRFRLRCAECRLRYVRAACACARSTSSPPPPPRPPAPHREGGLVHATNRETNTCGSGRPVGSGAPLSCLVMCVRGQPSQQ